MPRAPRELASKDLCRMCDPEMFSFESTEDIPPLRGVLGQKRAVEAIKFGLKIDSPGYNIFASGLSDTGKTTITKDLLKGVAETQPTPDDWVYVYNFRDPDRPRALSLPAGRARIFQREMRAYVKGLHDDLTKAFSDEAFEARRTELITPFKEKRNTLMKELEAFAAERSVGIKSTPVGLQTTFLLEKKPMSQEDYDELPAETRVKMDAAHSEVRDKLDATSREVEANEKLAKEAAESLIDEVALFVIRKRLATLKESYEGLTQVLSYLEDMEKDTLENLNDFLAEPGENGAALEVQMRQSERSLTRYSINVVVDNSETEGAPVVLESNPSYNNLCGRIEKRSQLGTLISDFTMIKGGSFHRANGGYVIVDVEGVLKHPFAWDALKRTLLEGEIRVEEVFEDYGLQSTIGMRPEPIPLSIKLVLLGRPEIFHLLQHNDETFRKLFRVRADFAQHTNRNRRTAESYARFISRVCREENLKHFDPAGVAAIVEFGGRLIDDQRRISTRFGDIVNIMREANHWATRNGREHVTHDDVDQAREQRRFRSNMYDDLMRQQIERDIVMVDVSGSVVGQVNGLAVY